MLLIVCYSDWEWIYTHYRQIVGFSVLFAFSFFALSGKHTHTHTMSLSLPLSSAPPLCQCDAGKILLAFHLPFTFSLLDIIEEWMLL